MAHAGPSGAVEAQLFALAAGGMIEAYHGLADMAANAGVEGAITIEDATVAVETLIELGAAAAGSGTERAMIAACGDREALGSLYYEAIQCRPLPVPPADLTRAEIYARIAAADGSIQSTQWLVSALLYRVECERLRGASAAAQRAECEALLILSELVGAEPATFGDHIVALIEASDPDALMTAIKIEPALLNYIQPMGTT